MEASFLLSAAMPSQFPDTSYPEVAFAGRSNVGKSSMINKLLERKNLVKTSSTPGKTKLINFFEVEKKYIFTDLPGYGYAAVSKKERDAWARLIEDYFRKRTQLKLAILLLDFRRDVSEDDKIMINAMRSLKINSFIVLTKSDKLSNNEKFRQLATISKSLGVDKSELIAFSSHSGQGRDEVWERIKELT